MISIDVNWSTYIYLYVGNNDKDSKFKVVDHERISKYRNIVTKSYTANFPKKFLVSQKLKKLCKTHMLPRTLNGENIFEIFLQEKDHKRQYNYNLELKS